VISHRIGQNGVDSLASNWQLLIVQVNMHLLDPFSPQARTTRACPRWPHYTLGAVNKASHTLLDVNSSGRNTCAHRDREAGCGGCAAFLRFPRDRDVDPKPLPCLRTRTARRLRCEPHGKHASLRLTRDTRVPEYMCRARIWGWRAASHLGMKAKSHPAPVTLVALQAHTAVRAAEGCTANLHTKRKEMNSPSFACRERRGQASLWAVLRVPERQIVVIVPERPICVHLAAFRAARSACKRAAQVVG